MLIYSERQNLQRIPISAILNSILLPLCFDPTSKRLALEEKSYILKVQALESIEVGDIWTTTSRGTNKVHHRLKWGMDNNVLFIP
jgi:hypothetical protein